MSDDFDHVLDRHFALKGSWSLFTAICLLQKVDPAIRGEPIDHTMSGQNPDGSTDYTIRPYKIALEAIQEAKAGMQPGEGEPPNLIEIDHKPDEIGAKRHFVNPRNFVKWAAARWPYASKHLVEAEARYQKSKRLAGMSRSEARSFAQKEFWRMVEEQKLDVKKRIGQTRRWACILEARLTRKGGSLMYDSESLRKFIPEWTDELG